MKSALLTKILPLLVLIGAAVALFVWLQGDHERVISMRVPGSDRGGEVAEVEEEDQPFVGELEKGSGVPGELTGDWPCFRGPGRDGISREGVRLAREWVGNGLKEVWRVELGEGHAGPAVYGGYVYILDYDREHGRDALRCLSFATGEEVWRYSYPVKIKRNHGMSRTTAAVTEGYVVTLGPKGQVICLDRESGELKWMIDLVKDYGTEIPPWYAGQCPLIDGGMAILAPAGDEVLMMAVDCESGQVKWKAPNRRGWKMTHTSIATVEYGGRKMYVYSASGGVAGVDAATGELLWDADQWKIDIAAIATPLPVGDGKVLLTGGYNAGAMMIQVVKEGEGFGVRELYRLQPEVFGATQQTPIFYEGYVYGIRPDGQLVCLDLEGETQWESGAAVKFALGPLVIGDGLIYALSDDGLLRLVEATAGGFVLLDEAQVLEGHDAWGPLALTGGRLLARDLTVMVCLEVGQ